MWDLVYLIDTQNLPTITDLLTSTDVENPPESSVAVITSW